jgi:glycosyltransferase involved in cell wall biosynthesis
MKKALVHDWYYTNGGAEKVSTSISNIWNDLEHFALIDFLSEVDRKIILKGKKARTSFIQKLPTAKKNHRKFLQLFPMAIEQFDLGEYNVVISSSSSIAKGVLTNQDQLHICYCHSPMRYAWDLHFEYLKDKNLTYGFKAWYAKKVLHKMRIWDVVSSNRVDFFVANSHYIAKRIKKIYNRHSTVIYPPVDVNKYTLKKEKKEYFLTASRLVPYKKIHLIAEAFNQMPSKELIIVGDGPDFKKIKNVAKDNINVLGRVKDSALVELMQNAKAFIFAAKEDFGILPVEAQSCGTPVIGYKKGGLLETVIENKTGVFFENQTSLDIKKAVIAFESLDFDATKIRQNAERFSSQRFEKEFKAFVEKKIIEFNS